MKSSGVKMRKRKRAEDIYELMELAVEKKATDLHISVGAKPRCRINGELKDLDDYFVIEPQDARNLLIPKFLDAKARSDFNTFGQYDTSATTPNTNTRFRINIFKQKGDIAGVLRVLNNEVPDYKTLGLPYNIFNMYKKRRGLILIVGPTGSGKSTTLASFLDIINQNLYKHIITLEDPIEYLHWHNRSIINQREIGTDCDSFANGLRAALREDPDVILVGEMRDLETTEIAITAAETGHLVCSTLHTLGAAETVNRIVDMFPQAQQNQIRSQLVGILEAVVSQQLLPRKDGKGYVVAFEIMIKNREIQNYIRDDNAYAISKYLKTKEAKTEGMISMDETIFQLFVRDIISEEVALSYAFDRKQLELDILNYRKKKNGKV